MILEGVLFSRGAQAKINISPSVAQHVKLERGPQDVELIIAIRVQPTEFAPGTWVLWGQLTR